MICCIDAANRGEASAPMVERFLLSSADELLMDDCKEQAQVIASPRGHVEIHPHTVQRCAIRSGLHESIDQPKYLPYRIRWRLRRSAEESHFPDSHATLRNHASGTQKLQREGLAFGIWHATVFRSPPARLHCHSARLAHFGLPRPDLAN
jgi:hypothetical protein